MVVILNLALRYCSRIVTMPKFEPQQYLELVQKYSATILHVVPPIVLFLAKHPMVGNYNLSSVKEIFSGAAPLGKELSEALIKRLGIKLLRQGYGMTELR
jgi:acyl-CoA synthetase (AMP-forming)/AMP-acid ligase II